MTLRNIIKIDQAKCNGCGQCVSACAEGAIKLINGKATLISETYCDGLGACLGHCPQDAITIEQRQAAEFDESAVKAHLATKNSKPAKIDFVCPGVMAQNLRDKTKPTVSSEVNGNIASQLTQWPVQLKLVSPNAPYFAGADLLLTADCVPFAMGDFHSKLLAGRNIVIGCPKLDDTEFYIEKLRQIIDANKLSSLTVVHMQVPCCSGLTRIAKEAIARSGTKIPFKDITISLSGDIIATDTIE